MTIDITIDLFVGPKELNSWMKYDLQNIYTLLRNIKVLHTKPQTLQHVYS